MRSGRDHLSVVAAGCAFYALYAIFPALTASISLYGLATDPATVDRHFAVLESVVPNQAYAVIIDQIRRIAETSHRSLGWSFGLSLLIALWLAHRWTQTMFAALNIAFDEPERRSLPRVILTAIGYTLIAIFALVAMLAVIVYVPDLFDATGHPKAIDGVLHYFRWPLLLIVMLLFLALLYRFGPSREEPKWHWITVGSVFATLVWMLASYGFSYYVAHFANYDRIYGSLGAVIVLLFWLYISFYIVLLGAEINAEVERWQKAGGDPIVKAPARGEHQERAASIKSTPQVAPVGKAPGEHETAP